MQKRDVSLAMGVESVNGNMFGISSKRQSIGSFEHIPEGHVTFNFAGAVFNGATYISSGGRSSDNRVTEVVSSSEIVSNRI